jgi:hypothetical protein
MLSIATNYIVFAVSDLYRKQRKGKVVYTTIIVTLMVFASDERSTQIFKFRHRAKYYLRWTLCIVLLSNVIVSRQIRCTYHRHVVTAVARVIDAGL